MASSSLNTIESAELAARLAALTQAGLPLEGGLRALAEELGQPRLSDVLRRMATRLEAGESLEATIAAQGSRLPAHLRGLIVAGVRTGHLPKVLDQFAEMSQRQTDLRRRLFLSLWYPALLLGIMAVLAVAGRYYIIDEFRSIFKDFGTKLPALTAIILDYAGTVAWTLSAIAIAAILLPFVSTVRPVAGWLGGLTTRLPVFGPIIAFERYSQFSNLMALFLEENVPMPESLHLTSIAMQGTPLATKCHRAATSVEGGQPVDAVFGQLRFPPTLTAFVAWGKQKNCLAEAFRAAGEAFEARAQSQGSLLNMVLLPVAYFAVVNFIGLVVLALFLPMVALMPNLCGGN